jgi:hypothetical protein
VRSRKGGKAGRLLRALVALVLAGQPATAERAPRQQVQASVGGRAVARKNGLRPFVTRQPRDTPNLLMVIG